MSRSLAIAGFLVWVALAPPLFGSHPVDVGVAAGEERSLEPAAQVPRERVDPKEQIDRGSRGLLEGQDELSPIEGEVGSSRVEILPRACELELALSAAPEHLRSGAGVWVLGERGFGRVRESKNGFDCIVNRDHPRALKPTCFDTAGAATIVPKIVEMGQWLIEELSPEEIRQREEYGFVSGAFEAPSRSGIAYMLSNYNRPWFPQSGTLGRFPPHVMFYAPNLTREDIGFDPQSFSADQRLPFLAYQGPHGFIIMITGENRSRLKGELKRCPTWVWK